MIDSVRIENLRSLLDTGLVELKPLTLLLGKNSSGKSSFLRFLPLLRQSFEAHTSGPILWYGPLVDLGGFKESLHSSSSTDEIHFGFGFQLKRNARAHVEYARTRTRRRGLQILGPLDLEIRYSFGPDPKDNSATKPRSVEIRIADHSVCLTYDNNLKISRFTVNDRNLLELYDEPLWGRMGGRFIPTVEQRDGEKDVTQERRLFADHRILLRELFSALEPMFHGNTAPSTIRRVMNRLAIGSSSEMLQHLQEIKDPGAHWRKRVENLTVKKGRFRKIKDLIIASNIPDLIDSINRILYDFATGIRYIKPLRATAERYYRLQDLAVEEVDPEGQNAVMFIRSLSDTERKEFEEWTVERFGWRIVARLQGGHLSLKLIPKEGGREYNLADVGFGFSQVLPVLLQLWALQSGRRVGFRRFNAPVTFVIEQPELHLHPSLQARVADVLIDAVQTARTEGIRLRLVVETHSEAIVNRVGLRVGEGKLDPNDASVILFELKEADVTRVRPANFDESGYLNNWPFGFFDTESSR